MDDRAKKKLMLLVIEGFGVSPSFRGNAVFSANPENIFSLWRNSPHSIISCQSSNDKETYPSDNTFLARLFSGTEVSSEHDFIDEQIKNQKFFFNEVFNESFDRAIKQNSALHLVGSLTDHGGKYGDSNHLISLVKLAKSRRIYKVYIHLLLDESLSSDEKEILAELDKLNRSLGEIGMGEIATITGRKLIDDKNMNPLDFIRAFRNIIMGRGKAALSAEQAITHLSNHNSFEDFSPMAITFHGKAIGRINNFDCVLFYNFDNLNISKFILSLVQSSAPFRGCEVPKFLDVVTMLGLSEIENKNIKVAFRRRINDGISEYLQNNGLSQYVISDSSRIGAIRDIYLEPHHRNSGLIKTAIIPASLSLSEYFSNYEQTLDALAHELSAQSGESAPDFILMMLPSIARAARHGAVKDIIGQIKLIDSYIPKLLSLAKSQSYDVMVASSHGLSANLSQAGALRQNLAPFFFAGSQKEVLAVQTQRDFHSSLMYDILKKKNDLIDIAPSLLEWFNILKPESMKGKSFLKELISK